MKLSELKTGDNLTMLSQGEEGFIEITEPQCLNEGCYSVEELASFSEFHVEDIVRVERDGKVIYSKEGDDES